MQAARRGACPPIKSTVSLKRNFGWTFAGNVCYAASQWAILSLIAKLGDARMLGRYALAVALVMPVAMLSHLNLRAVLATDVEERRPFGDYLVVRLAAAAAGFAAIVTIAFTSNRADAGVVVLVGAALSLENISDLYYGLLQRRERMDGIARSLVARSALSVLALAAALWLTRDLLWAAAALALARGAVLLSWDRRAATPGERLERSGGCAQREIFRSALPLGIVLMLVSFATNLPRYVVERDLGTRELGAFAAVASFITIGSTVVNALGQTATPRLARYYGQRDAAAFRALALRIVALSWALGLAGVLAAALAGGFVLRVVYRPEYSAYSGLLVLVLAAGSLTYVGITLGYVITSVRSFGPQMFLFTAVAASSGVASWVLVPAAGLAGAAGAIAAAALVQISGELVILRRAWRRVEAPR